MRAPTGARIHILPNVDELAEAAASELAARMAEAVAQRGEFALAVSGGRTPEPLYRRLGAPPLSDAVPWQAVKLFFADERAVPLGHPDSNYHMVHEAWLKKSPAPPGRVFRMEGEATNLYRAAERYSQLLTAEVANGATGFPALDLVMLGVGEDGHTASLFPKTAALNETLRVVAANEVPQLGAWRLTLTYPTLDAAREVWFLVSGASKAHRVAQCLGFAPGGEDLPAALVHNVWGNMHWWLDESAAGEIPRDPR